MKEQLFQVGDVVWCLIYGKGRVVANYSDDAEEPYPVSVKFDDGDACYTADGEYSQQGNRTLFFSEPKVEAKLKADRPFVPEYVGKKVFFKGKTSGYIYGPYDVKRESTEWWSTDDGDYVKSAWDIFVVQDEA